MYVWGVCVRLYEWLSVRIDTIGHIAENNHISIVSARGRGVIGLIATVELVVGVGRGDHVVQRTK